MPSMKTVLTIAGVSLLTIGLYRSNALGVGTLIASIFPTPKAPGATE